MADITERIEKQMEGTNLALAAVAEVLQKMDGRLAKEEHDAAADAQASAQEAARANLVKSIASEVLTAIKKDTEGKGLPVSGSERKAKSTGGTPQNADDSESSANPDTKIEDQQNTIQAMRKQDEDEEEAEEEKGGMAYKQEEEEADEEGEEAEEMKAMRKQIAAMKKQLEATEAGMQKAIQTEAENRLRKMGFREENGLQAPKIAKGFGVDDTPVLQKSAGVDTPDQLAQLSYSELRRLQQQIEMGNTDGVPRELLG